MDDKIRSNAIETNESEDNLQKNSRRRRTPSADPSDRGELKSKRNRSRSRTHSRSPSRDRRRRSRSRGHYSPDRRYGRQFGRGGYQQQRDNNFYNRRRRSPSRSPYRRNRNARRSRSTSYDRHRNRRNKSTSRERSMSQGRGENNRAPQPPQPPQVATAYPNDYAPTPFQPEYQVAPPAYQNPQFGNYDYVPMMQPPPTSFPAYPPPPTQEYMWSAQVPPPPIISCAPAAMETAPIASAKPISNSAADEEEQKRQAAIAAEKKIQRDTIRKQRDGYIRRASALKRELITLKEQRQELITGNDPPSPTTNGFIKENDKLQIQIENKIGTIENVIEMLNGILSTDKSDNDSPKKSKSAQKQEEPANSDDSSPERLKTKVIESLSRKRKESDRNRRDEKSSKSTSKSEIEQINFTFFDPEQHWCKVCSSFPKTAKEYLLHLHSEEHKANVKQPEIPWHDHLVKDDMPVYPNAPTKRTPIRGLQFFVPSTAWYCKLCSFWIGDLHCASTHLKSQTHAREYEKFATKNQSFENEWLIERQKAFDSHHERESEQSQKVIAPPSPPIISSQKQIAAPLPPAPPQIASFGNTSNRLFDGIPLQLNQRAKEVKDVSANEEVEKKRGKKKKKEKKKRKKSKKKHRHSSSSSSSSTEESSVSGSPERKLSAEQTIDSTTSIRVAMRNAVNAVPPRAHLKPKSDDEEPQDAGGWTVVQPETRVIPPKPPTISANGEEQNRRDDAMLSQWTPLPVISDKEKQLFEQLKGKLKDRDEKKKDKLPPATTVQNTVQSQSNPPHQSEGSSERSSKTSDKRRDESDHGFKEVREKDRRDAYRKRRSRSTSSPRRDRDRDRRRSPSRSPRRDRRRRSRSPSPRRDRRYSRSPRRDRRRDRYSRSRSKDRQFDRNDLKDKNIKTSDKPPAKKQATSVHTGKKLPFIGRMPVFKKQTTDDDSKKQEPTNQVVQEENLIEKKKKDELKFQIHQKQQLLQLHQKQAEAYNLAHPGQFANIYSTHGTIHHILPTVQAEEYDLMPDPMQYATLMTAAPPPPMAPPQEPEISHFKEADEPVLPPGIDVEEAESMELEAVIPPPPPPSSDRDNILPKDFQDALSIIFDKGVEKSSEEVAAIAPIPIGGENPTEITNVVMQEETSNFVQMDVSPMDTQPSQDLNNGATNIELDDQSQYIYAEEHYVQNHIQQSHVVPSSIEPQSIDLAPQNIPTPPIQILDAAGNLTKIPGPVLEVGSDFVVLDSDGNRIDKINYAIATEENVIKMDAGQTETEQEIELKLKRQQELDDLAMLGIDADDLAAQCI